MRKGGIMFGKGWWEKKCMKSIESCGHSLYIYISHEQNKHDWDYLSKIKLYENKNWTKQTQKPEMQYFIYWTKLRQVNIK
jgi:predicted DNA-binding ArsR family transcriptional regulator